MNSNTSSSTTSNLLPIKLHGDAIQEALNQIEEERSGRINGLFTRWEGINRAKMKYWRFRNVTLMAGMSGCHGKGQKIIMFSGELKNVEEIVEGDKLMGIDSTPRVVQNLLRGRDKMYWIRQNKGLDYRVNGEHILCLKERSRFQKGKELNQLDKICNISVNDYKTKNTTYTYYHKGWKTGVEFTEQETKIDPYFLGLWLGDGGKDRPAITTMDKEIVDYIYKASNFLGYKVNVNHKKNNKASSYYIHDRKGRTNTITGLLRELNLFNNKHIPNTYLYNSREVRLELLAGLIDTDGSYSKEKKCFELSSSKEEFANQMAYLVRSLGFYCSVSKKKSTIKSTGFEGIAYRVMIYGNNLSIIPTKIPRKKGENSTKIINPLITGITVEEDIEDDYYGFTLDGDNLYLLEDFTVTHNSGKSAILNMIEDDFTNPLLNPTFLLKRNFNENSWLWDGEVIHDPKIIVVAFKYEMDASDEILRNLSGKVGKSYSYLLSAEKAILDKDGNPHNASALDKANYNKVTDEEFTNYKEELRKQANRPIIYVESAGNLTQLMSTCKSVKDSYPGRRLVVTIDHTLLSLKLSEKDDLQLMSETAKTCIKLKKDMNAMVIPLGQMNGEIEKVPRRDNIDLQFPLKTDIHGANQVFWACDDVLIWHRPELLNIERYGKVRMVLDGDKEVSVHSINARDVIHCNWIKSRKNRTGHVWFLNKFNEGKIIQVREQDIRWIKDAI